MIFARNALDSRPTWQPTAQPVRLQRIATPSLLLGALYGAALSLLALGCGEELADPIREEAPVEVEEDRPPAAPQEMTDIRPPSFAGVGEVALVGLDLFQVSWEPATDDVSDPSAIVYKVYHIVEPYEELDDETPSLFTSEPGASSATLAHDSVPGRFYVRAVDEAGNTSPVTSGLLQRRSRPLLRGGDGTLAAKITQCADLEPGRALCVGEDGFIARWEFNHWEPLDLGGIVATLRIASTPSGLFVFTEVGHLFFFDEAGEPQLVDVTFPRRQPELPFRQFTADHLGLRYWLDAEGRVFVGAGREFVPMSRPLALPGVECRRLQGLTFSSVAAFAACTEGVAYSANSQQPRFTWLSLTPNASFEVSRGFRGVLAENDTEGLLYDETGIRRVGVGGWTPVLLVDWNVPGVHPMDVPEDPPPISYVSQVFRHGDVLRAATDLGLLEYVGAAWELVENTEGELAGLVGPAAHDESAGDTLIYSDGAVGRLRGSRRSWLIEQHLQGFSSGWKGSGEQVYAVRNAGDRSGIYQHVAGEWERVFELLPDGTVGTTGGGDAILAFGQGDDGIGMIWAADGGTWDEVQWLYEPTPEPVDEDEEEEEDAEEEDAEEDGFVFDEVQPPAPLSGVPFEDALAGSPAPTPFVHVDVVDDGRGVGVTRDQVWWRMNGGWRLVHQSDARILAGFVDAGESWVIVTEAGNIRCWRDQCDDAGVPQVEGGPDSVRTVLVDDGGWVVVDVDGRLHRFAPAAGEAPEGSIEPSFETPAGTWETAGSIGRYGDNVSSYHRTGETEVLLTNAGEVLERIDDQWVLQADDPSLLAVLPLGDSWGVLSPGGLFRLGVVRTVVRELEEEEMAEP